MANLFEISEELLELMNVIEDAGGEITEEVAAKLDITKEQLEQKIKQYYYIIKLRSAEVQTAKDEKERLNTKQKAKENLVKRLKQTISVAVDLFGVIPNKKKAKTLTFDTLSIWNKESFALKIEDETLIPSKYLSKSITFDLNDVDKVKQLLEDNNISFIVDPNNIIKSDVIKAKLESEKDLPDEEKQVLQDEGKLGVTGASLTKNITPVFN